MRTNLLLLCLALTALLNGCSKAPFNDLSGSATFKGVLMLQDTLYGDHSYRAIKNTTVYLGNPTDTASYLYPIKTDVSGNFNFTNIDSTVNYSLRATFDSTNLRYVADSTYTPANKVFLHRRDTLILRPDVKSQNILHIVVMDASYAPVGNVTVHVFNNSGLFHADTAAGKVFDMVSNAAGRDNRSGLAAGWYYFRINTQIGNTFARTEDSINIGNNGLWPKALIINNGSTAFNGIEVRVTDKFTTPVSGATVYFYRSLDVFNNDPSPYNNSLFSRPTNASGMANAYIIEPATYYVRVVKVVSSSLTLTGTGQAIVGLNNVFPLPVTIQ
jgi:hypothetical protein